MGSSTPTWYSKDTVVVITVSNKGIGFQILKDISKHGITSVLIARDVGRGEKAVAALKVEGFDTVVLYPSSLEVNSQESVDKFAAWLKSEFGGVDILINNAGLLATKLTYKAAKDSVDINYYVVKRVTKALLPLMRPGGQILNMGTSLGMLSHLKNESLTKKLDVVDDLSEEFIDSCATKFVEDVKAGRLEEEGWSPKTSNYTQSKIFLHAYTRYVAKILASSNKILSANAIHLGFIATDMTKDMDPWTTAVEIGADTPVWLALLPEENYPSGQLFFQRKAHDFVTSF